MVNKSSQKKTNAEVFHLVPQFLEVPQFLSTTKYLE